MTGEGLVRLVDITDFGDACKNNDKQTARQFILWLRKKI